MTMTDNSLPTLWLIPARGGSKGIPGKNLKPFRGRPLVALAAMQALECAAPEDTVFVSTDSPAIRDAVFGLGDVVPFMRPAEFATDTSSTYDVIMHAVSEFSRRGKRFSRVVLLQPTSPLRLISDIRETLALWRPDIDMAVTVCPAKTNPYFNAFEADSEGMLHISKGDGTVTRRQDAPPVWEYNGAVYVMTVSSLEKGPISSFRRILPSPMPESRSADLDTPADWAAAEAAADF